MASEEPKRAAGVESFATETKKEGENIVREVFPAKVVEMEELLRVRSLRRLARAAAGA